MAVKKVSLTVEQAQQILDFLLKCPAGQVYDLIGYLVEASK